MDQSQVAIDATNKLNLVKQRLRKTLDPELSFRIVDQSESERVMSALIGQLEKAKRDARNFFQKVIRHI